MRPIIQDIVTGTTPELLCQQLRGIGGVVLLRTARFEDERARYSFVTARPMLTFRSYGSHCEVRRPEQPSEAQFGNPWRLLDVLMSRFEILDEVDMPFPLGGCFGYWGYGLKNFVEPRLSRFAVDDLDLPDCEVGFYDSLVVFDHRLNRTWIVSTGLAADGSRTRGVAESRIDWWRQLISASESGTLVFEEANPCNGVSSNLSR